MIDTFHTRLRKIAANCDFHDADNEIKIQLIQGCTSHQLRLKALQESLTLSKLLATARSMEMSIAQASEMENDHKVNQLRTSEHRKEKKCYRCGGQYPHSKECPAKGKKCNHCKGLNHFETVCFKKRKSVKYIETGIREISDEEETAVSSEPEYI